MAAQGKGLSARDLFFERNGTEARARLEGTAAQLDSVSPLAVLGRGYALVTDRAGLPITSAARVKPGARLGLRFADGDVKATADGGTVPSRQGLLAL